MGIDKGGAGGRTQASPLQGGSLFGFVPAADSMQSQYAGNLAYPGLTPTFQVGALVSQMFNVTSIISICQ